MKYWHVWFRRKNNFIYLSIYLSLFLRWRLMLIILIVIFRTVVLIIIVVSWNISAAVSSSLLQVSFIYLGIEMIQPMKSF